MSAHRWKLEQCLFDAAVVVHVDGILEHVIHEVGIRFYKVIKHIEYLQVFLLLFEESVEGHVIRVDVHLVEGLSQVLPVRDYGFVSFLDLLLLLLKAFEFLVNLFLHHLI